MGDRCWPNPRLGAIAGLLVLQIAACSGASNSHDTLARIGRSPIGLAYDEQFRGHNVSEHFDRLTIDPTTGTTYAGYLEASSGELYDKTIFEVDTQGHVSVMARLGKCHTHSTAVAFDPLTRSLAATCNHRIVRISTTGSVSSLVGNEEAGHRDGFGSQATFDEPFDLVYDDKGNLYVADDEEIRIVSPDGRVKTLAGSCIVNVPFGLCKMGMTDGRGAHVRFGDVVAMTFDSIGRRLFVADDMNDKIQSVSLDGEVRTVAGACISLDDRGICMHGYGLRDGRGTGAEFNDPFGIAFVPAHDVFYVADWSSNAIRKVKPDGEVTTILHTVGRSGPRGIAYNPVTRLLEWTDGEYIRTLQPR
jgi:DNA-binding beta-propeller fold protein YncE